MLAIHDNLRLEKFVGHIGYSKSMCGLHLSVFMFLLPTGGDGEEDDEEGEGDAVQSAPTFSFAFKKHSAVLISGNRRTFLWG